MDELIMFLCGAFQIIMMMMGVYFAVISLFMLKHPKDYPETTQHLRFAVLLPARNEEACVANIIESIRKQDYPQELIDIYVIPNNCIDRTEEAAAEAGANILRVSDSVKSKGQALHEAFQILLATEQHEAYCVFDADNEPDSAFLAEMNKALSVSRVAKSRILAKNPHDSWICSCYDIFFCNANLLLNRSRQSIGMSAHLIGTGFAVRRDLMQEMHGWNTRTLTEDAEFYAQLSAMGEHIAFVPKAITYDEEPLTFRTSLIQRRRWMSGILEVVRTYFEDLLHGLISGVGSWACMDCLLQLGFVFLQAMILPVFCLRLCVDFGAAVRALPAAAAGFYLSSAALGGLSLIMERRMTWKKGAALLLYPIFLFSFFPLQTISLVVPSKKWKPITHSGKKLALAVEKQHCRSR